MTERLVLAESERVGAWVGAMCGRPASPGLHRSMGVEKDGRLVAGAMLDDYNGTCAAMSIAIARPPRLLGALFGHVAAYAFGQCGLARLAGFVDAPNARSLRLAAKAGWREEGIMRGAGRGGADVAVLALWPRDYEEAAAARAGGRGAGLPPGWTKGSGHGEEQAAAA